MAAPEGAIGLERRGHVAVVTLQRPDALNAITMTMAERLAGVLAELAGDRDVWVVVLAAEGERAFCAGADLAERKGMSVEQLVARRDTLRRMFAAVRETPQPTIAAVFGHVVGGGFELALSCDLIVAADDASLGLPEARVGLVPAGGGTFLLSRAIGAPRAKELIFTGRRIDARAASELGIVSDVVARGELAGAALALAERIVRSSPVATRAAKRAIERGLHAEAAAGLEAEEEALAEAVASRDAAEGVSAFAERRDPVWENR